MCCCWLVDYHSKTECPRIEMWRTFDLLWRCSNKNVLNRRTASKDVYCVWNLKDLVFLTRGLVAVSCTTLDMWLLWTCQCESCAPSPQDDPRNSEREKVCQNPHPAINFHYQNPLPKTSIFDTITGFNSTHFPTHTQICIPSLYRG